MTKKEITIWQRWDSKSEEWKHDHIQDGWTNDEMKPVELWKKELGWLVVDGKSHEFFGHTNWPHVVIKVD